MHDRSCKHAFLVVFLIGLLLFNCTVTIAMLFLRIQFFFFKQFTIFANYINHFLQT